MGFFWCISSLPPPSFVPIKNVDIDSSSQMTEQRKQKQRIGLLGHAPHMNINPQQPAWRWMWWTVTIIIVICSVFVGSASKCLPQQMLLFKKKEKKGLVSYVPLGVSLKCKATWESIFFCSRKKRRNWRRSLRWSRRWARRSCTKCL